MDRTRTCWTFGRAPGEVWFWIRRQALEAAIHRWDAELAVGRPSAIAAELASAGIAEVVDDLLPRQVALGRTAALSKPVLLRATDTGEQWVVSGIDSLTEPAATVEASTGALLLLLWRRTDLDDPDIAVSGSPDVTQELRATRFAP